LKNPFVVIPEVVIGNPLSLKKEEVDSRLRTAGMTAQKARKKRYVKKRWKHYTSGEGIS
jgi:hypothetical protein